MITCIILSDINRPAIMGLTIMKKFCSVLSFLVLSGCGVGMQTVCGVPFSDNGAGSIVNAQDVAPLPGASFKTVDTNTWQLEQGGFASASDGGCQFGVRNGHVYR
jgi:hypothetical protein